VSDPRRAIVSYLTSAGIEAADVREIPASLEDVFISRLEEAEA
jgi:hypothetical protein